MHLFEADDYGRRRFTTIAEKPTTVNKLSIFEFQKTLIEFPEFAEKLIKLQASQLITLIMRKCEVTLP